MSYSHILLHLCTLHLFKSRKYAARKTCEKCSLIILRGIAPKHSLRTRSESPELKSSTTEARTSRGTLLVRLYLGRWGGIHVSDWGSKMSRCHWRYMLASDIICMHYIFKHFACFMILCAISDIISGHTCRCIGRRVHRNVSSDCASFLASKLILWWVEERVCFVHHPWGHPSSTNSEEHYR